MPVSSQAGVEVIIVAMKPLKEEPSPSRQNPTEKASLAG